MTLAEFLLARIAEDEESAKSVNGNRTGPPAQWTAAEVAAAYARHLLAECEAKRRIVEHHQYWQQSRTSTFEGWTGDTATAYRMAMDWTLQLLALPYADHPDYLPEWHHDPENAESAPAG